MAFNEDKAQLVGGGIVAALHNLQTTAGNANVRVQQVVVILDPGTDVEMVQYTWDSEVEKWNIATLGDDSRST